MSSTLPRPVRALGKAGWGVWAGVVAVMLYALAGAVREAPVFAATSGAIAYLNTDSATTRENFGRVVAPSLYRQVDYVRRARHMAPGDSIKIGITIVLSTTDGAGTRTINTKWEEGTGTKTVGDTSGWTLLAAHSNLPETTKRDSAFVPRPPSGVTWTYRACAQTARTGTTPTPWLCKIFTYKRPAVTPPPVDTIHVDSSNVKIARLFLTPGSANVAGMTAACKSSVTAGLIWKDASQKTPVDACMGDIDPSANTVLRPMVIQFCSYAQFQDLHWELTSNSSPNQRCRDELPAVEAGQVLGAIYAPGEEVRISTVMDGRLFPMDAPLDTVAQVPAPPDLRTRS